MQNKIIVFGGSHHNTLGVVRALGEKGIRPYVLIANDHLKRSLVLKSRYVEKGWILKSENECLDFITNHFTNKEDKNVIICTSDTATSCVDLNYERLIENFHIPNGERQGSLNHLMIKEVMNNVAKGIGMTVPTTWHIQNIIDIIDVEYPCITKPVISIRGTKDDIVRCANKTELINFLTINNAEKDILVQKLIEIDFEFQLIGCSIEGGKEVIIPGYTKIIRSASTSNTGFLEYRPIHELSYDHERCVEFIRSCNYSGLFSLEFIRDNAGVDNFLEINFRNDGNAYSVVAAGVNLPYIWVSSLLGLDFREEATKPIRPILVMPELDDVFQVIFGKISLKKWLKDIKQTDCFIYYNKNDIKPFLFELYVKICFTLRKSPKIFNWLFK